MTVHVSGRSTSALMLLSVSLLGLPADALAQSVAARSHNRTTDGRQTTIERETITR